MNIFQKLKINYRITLNLYEADQSMENELIKEGVRILRLSVEEPIELNYVKLEHPGFYALKQWVQEQARRYGYYIKDPLDGLSEDSCNRLIDAEDALLTFVYERFFRGIYTPDEWEKAASGYHTRQELLRVIMDLDFHE